MALIAPGSRRRTDTPYRTAFFDLPTFRGPLLRRKETLHALVGQANDRVALVICGLDYDPDSTTSGGVLSFG